VVVVSVDTSITGNLAVECHRWFVHSKWLSLSELRLRAGLFSDFCRAAGTSVDSLFGVVFA
jgi:hypothetical protein